MHLAATLSISAPTPASLQHFDNWNFPKLEETASTLACHTMVSANSLRDRTAYMTMPTAERSLPLSVDELLVTLKGRGKRSRLWALLGYLHGHAVIKPFPWPPISRHQTTVAISPHSSIS